MKSTPPYPARWQPNAVTVAGGHSRGDRTDQLNWPNGLFVDDNQTVYVADYMNHRIMGWRLGASTGEVLAGGNGQGHQLNQLDRPTDVIMDRKNDSLLICDRDNRRVMRWPRYASSRRQPEMIINNIKCWGLTMDNQGSLYVSDQEKHEVRRYDKNGDKKGIVVAGGHGKGANLNQLDGPTYLFVDAKSTLYVSDYSNHRVMKWEKAAKEGIIVAGGNRKGGDLKQLSYPRGLWVDGYGHVYVVDQLNHRVIRWEKGAKHGTVIAGGNGQGLNANQLTGPDGLFFDCHGHLYVSDTGYRRVQRFSLY